jgi:hypothetical protein
LPRSASGHTAHEDPMRTLFWLYVVMILAGLATAIVLGALGR